MLSYELFHRTWQFLYYIIKKILSLYDTLLYFVTRRQYEKYKNGQHQITMPSGSSGPYQPLPLVTGQYVWFSIPKV